MAASAEHRKEAAGGRPPRETTLRQSLCTLDFWLLWTGLFIGIGSGFTFLNNLGEQLPGCGLAVAGAATFTHVCTAYACSVHGYKDRNPTVQLWRHSS